MTPAESYRYTQEHAALIQEASQLERLIEHPGWRVIEDILSAMQSNAHHMALHAPTDNPTTAIDLLRKWQLTDEVVSSIRATILQTIQNAKDLAPRDDSEKQMLKELLHGRTDGDPDGN